MLHIKRFTVNPIQENTFLIWDDNKEGAVIDCGLYYDDEKVRFSEFISREGIHLTKAIQTHAHFDHVLGLPYIYKEYGIRPVMHSMDLPIYEYFHRMVGPFGLQVGNVQMPEVEAFLTDGDIISVGDEQLRVIHTPGHTPGGVCLYSEANDVCFSGDTLFNSSIGRSDLPGGNGQQLITSIRERLLTLPHSTTVMCGHGGRTTIEHEIHCNPFL